MTDRHSPQSLEARRLRGPVPAEFEQFYRRALRYWPGGRMRSLDLASAYQQWAVETGAQPLGYRAIRTAMTNVGHGHCQCSVMFYKDVRFAAELPGIADNYPAPSAELVDASLVDQMDRTLSELLKLRSRIAAS